MVPVLASASRLELLFAGALVLAVVFYASYEADENTRYPLEVWHPNSLNRRPPTVPSPGDSRVARSSRLRAVGSGYGY